MGTARDIALIFLSLEALVIALIPMLLIGGLAYGIYYLRKMMKEYLIVGQGYAEKMRLKVEEVAKSVSDPFIQIHTKSHQVTTMLKNLTSRRS